MVASSGALLECRPLIRLRARSRSGHCFECAKCREGMMNTEQGDGGEQGQRYGGVVRRWTFGKRKNPRVEVGAWPDPPKAPDVHANVVALLLPWAESEGAIGRDLEVLQGLLDIEYLVIVPLPLEAAELEGRDPRDPSRLRYLFCCGVATVLHWTYRRPFPPAIDELLRGQIWPN
jgi:hypothetical protein